MNRERSLSRERKGAEHHRYGSPPIIKQAQGRQKMYQELSEDQKDKWKINTISGCSETLIDDRGASETTVSQNRSKGDGIYAPRRRTKHYSLL